jgi:iron(III) transport system substrate-binding protein
MRPFRSTMQAVDVLRCLLAGDERRQQALKFRTSHHPKLLPTHAGRRLLVGSAVAMLGVTAAACGGNSATSSSVKTGAKAQTPQQLLAAANREGTLTWYSPNDPSLSAKVVAAFTKVYPKIHVNVVTLTPDSQVVSRLATEQRGGKYVADISITGSISTAELIANGNLEPYTIPTEQALPSNLSLPAGYRGMAYLETSIIAYNPAALHKHHLSPPTSIQDFTKPQWRGLFGIVVNGAEDAYPSYVVSMGQPKALSLFKALGNNAPVLEPSHSGATVAVQAGELPAALFVAGDDSVAAHQQTPTRYSFVNLNPLPTTYSTINLVKNAPHPAAAKLFLDWYESQAGQQANITITGHISIRTDVANPPSIWNPTTWTPAYTPITMSASEYNSWIAQMHAAIHAPLTGN